jgi:hypothetical protein
MMEDKKVGGVKILPETDRDLHMFTLPSAVIRLLFMLILSFYFEQAY